MYGSSEFRLGMEACPEVSLEQDKCGACVPLVQTSMLCSDGRGRHRVGHIEHWLGGIREGTWVA